MGAASPGFTEWTNGGGNRAAAHKSCVHNPRHRRLQFTASCGGSGLFHDELRILAAKIPRKTIQRCVIAVFVAIHHILSNEGHKLDCVLEFS